MLIENKEVITMPDITMCKNDLCPKRKSCYRFTVAPSEYQSYFIFETPQDMEDFAYDCGFYWRVK